MPMRNTARVVSAARLGPHLPTSSSRGPVALLVWTALLCTPAIAGSLLNLDGARVVFDNVAWSGSALGAAIATIWAVNGTTGRTRKVRMAGAAAFVLWLLSNLAWTTLALTGAATIPSISDAFVFAILVPAVVLMVACVHGRMTVAEEIAVYLDSLLVAILITTALLHVHGPGVVTLPLGAAVVALGYPIAFTGLAAAGLIAVMGAGYPLALRGPLPLLAGTGMVGLAYLGWVVPTVNGAAAGSLSSLLFTVGTLVAAFGASTWTDERSRDDQYLWWARYISRIGGPVVASLLLLLYLVPASPAVEPLLRASIFVGGVVFVIRQGLLLKERTNALESVTALTGENARLVRELRTELDRRAANESRLIQASRAAAVGELAAGVAHEVNNPLTGVLGFAELVLADLPADDPHRTDLETIRDEALRARRIVEGLREFGAPAAPALEPTDLAGLVRRTVDLVRYSIERRGVTIAEMLPELPPVPVDPHAIQQALLNVVTNAGQAVGEHGRIDIALRAEDDDVVLTVRDDGVGMDEATLSQALEPFFTARPAEPGAPPSRGLGLSITTGLIESHGGTIVLDSRPGHGTLVEFRLPATRTRTP
jgi:signal transduction histidine kinase